MERLRIAGVLWIAVAVLSIAVTVVFRVDSNQVVATVGLGSATAVLGLLMLARPSRVAIPASIIAGIAWLVLYAGLAGLQSDELAALVTDAFLAVAGGGVGLVAWTAGAQLDRVASRARMMTATTASHGAATARTPWQGSGQNEFKRLPEAT